MPDTEQDSSKIDPQKWQELQDAQPKIEQGNEIQAKADNVNGQTLTDEDYTQADVVQWSSEAIKNGEININVDSANENVYLKQVKQEDGTYKLEKASYNDRFEFAMQKSFVDSIAGLPVDLALDSVYTGFVSHFVRDTVKTVVEKKVINKLKDFWADLDKVVCDVAFTPYDPNPLTPTTSAFMLPSSPLDSSARFEMAGLEEMVFTLGHDVLPTQNNTGDDTTSSDVSTKVVDSTPEFFYISKDGTQHDEVSTIGTMKLHLTFKDMDHFGKFNSIVSKVGDRCHISLKFRGKTHFLFLGTSRQVFHDYDLQVRDIEVLKFTATDKTISRTYVFDIIERIKPDIELTFNSTVETLTGFFSNEKDITSYRIHCSNSNATQDHNYISMKLKARPFTKEVSTLASISTPSSPISTEKLEKRKKEFIENLESGKFGFNSISVGINKPSGKVWPVEHLNGLPLYGFQYDYQSNETVRDDSIFNQKTTSNEQFTLRFIFRSFGLNNEDDDSHEASPKPKSKVDIDGGDPNLRKTKKLNDPDKDTLSYTEPPETDLEVMQRQTVNMQSFASRIASRYVK